MASVIVNVKILHLNLSCGEVMDTVGDKGYYSVKYA